MIINKEKKITILTQGFEHRRLKCKEMPEINMLSKSQHLEERCMIKRKTK